MTLASPFTREAVAEALRRRRIDLDPGEFLRVLEDIVNTTETLTAGEQRFLEQAGAAPEMFNREAARHARLQLSLMAERSDARAAKGFTTREVANLLGTQPSNVRRLLAARSLYASGRAARAEHVFPAWQFVDSQTGGKQPAPHLRETLDALPNDIHPLDVESFMTEPREPLGGRSPVDWLRTGGDPGAVVALAQEEAWA